MTRFGRIFHYVQVMPSGRKAHDDENLYRKLTVKELNEYAGNDQVCCVTLKKFAPKTSHVQIFLKLSLQVENDKIILKT